MADAFDWDTATNDARELWIGENIMGWRLDVWGGIEGWRDGDKWKGGTAAFRFTTDAAADYLVLERVREWDIDRRQSFEEALRATWVERNKQCGFAWEWTMRYEPGDYSTAAYRALQETDR